MQYNSSYLALLSKINMKNTIKFTLFFIVFTIGTEAFFMPTNTLKNGLYEDSALKRYQKGRVEDIQSSDNTADSSKNNSPDLPDTKKTVDLNLVVQRLAKEGLYKRKYTESTDCDTSFEGVIDDLSDFYKLIINDAVKIEVDVGTRLKRQAPLRLMQRFILDTECNVEAVGFNSINDVLDVPVDYVYGSVKHLNTMCAHGLSGLYDYDVISQNTRKHLPDCSTKLFSFLPLNSLDKYPINDIENVISLSDIQRVLKKNNESFIEYLKLQNVLDSHLDICRQIFDIYGYAVDFLCQFLPELFEKESKFKAINSNNCQHQNDPNATKSGSIMLLNKKNQKEHLLFIEGKFAQDYHKRLLFLIFVHSLLSKVILCQEAAVEAQKMSQIGMNILKALLAPKEI